MATAKVREQNSKQRYLLVHRNSYTSGDRYFDAMILDHLPSSADINDYIDENGYSDEEVLVIELGRVGTLTREVTITF